MPGRVRNLIGLAILPLSGLFAENLAGIWQGTVKNPDTQQELHTVLKIAEGTPITANFYSIDQTYLVFPGTITLQGSTVKMSIPGIAATYEGKLSADGNAMTGTVKGFSVPTAWNMKRVPESEAWAIPKPPVPLRPMAADADPAFEVAVIKPSNPDGAGPNAGVRDSNVSLRNLTLAEMVRQIYDVHPNQVIGLPAWASSQKYDIAGKPDVEGQPSADQVKGMVRKLMADRFHLTFHKEQRELPVFTLNLGKGGAKISRNKESNDTSGVIFRAPGSVLLNNLTMDEFSKMLQSNAVDRPVVNQTGLQGKYTFSLVWTPDGAVVAIPNTNSLAPIDKADVPPDVFGAVQQQLGLKLEATKLRVDVMVIDKVEKPTEN